MSEKNPTEVERRELQFVCQACGASAGEWCRAWKRRVNLGIAWIGLTRIVPDLHVARFRSATFAGLLPLDMTHG